MYEQGDFFFFQSWVFMTNSATPKFTNYTVTEFSRVNIYVTQLVHAITNRVSGNMRFQFPQRSYKQRVNSVQTPCKQCAVIRVIGRRRIVSDTPALLTVPFSLGSINQARITQHIFCANLKFFCPSSKILR